MSISTVRNFLEKPSCAIGCAAVMTIAVAVGLFQVNCPRTRGRGEEPGEISQVARIGEYEITAQAIAKHYEDQTRRFAQVGVLPPELEATLLTSALQGQVDAGLVLALAKQKGVAATEDTAMAAIGSLWAQREKSIRMQLEVMGKIKQNATPKEVADAFLKEAKVTLESQREAMQTGLQQALRDPLSRDQVLAELSMPAILETYRRTAPVTDADLRSLNDTWVFKTIVFGSGEAGMNKARVALQELRSGATFEQLLKKYGPNPSAKDAASTNTETSVPKRNIFLTPGYEPLISLKTGQVSDPLDLPEGIALYKLLQVKPNVPKDFEQTKQQIRDRFLDDLANMKLRNELEAMRRTAKIEWTSPGYEALYRYSSIARDMAAVAGPDRRKRLTEVESFSANALSAADPVGQRAAALALYQANSELYNSASEAERDAMTDRRIAAIEAVLRQTESIALRIELVDLFAFKKKGTEASEQLLLAAQQNQGSSVSGDSDYTTVSGKLEMLRKEKLIPADMAKLVQEELARYRRDKLEHEKQRKLDEEMRKRDEAEAKKAAEEERKRAEAQSKAKAAAPGKAPATTGR